MTSDLQLPHGVGLARSTPTFDEESVPAGLLAAHRVADGVWGRLVVSSGSVRFVFESDDAVVSNELRMVHPRVVSGGEVQVIPPGRPHHLEVVGPVTFCVEFYR